MKQKPGTAEVWEETVKIPTYGVGKPDKNPMFLEKRVYQGSSGKVYPYPVIDKIYDKKEDKEYHAVFLENDYLKIMVLPELGGRIQRAYDKTNDYDFVYHNKVIKPALVGLTGPWISGGIEFNWPQHHRPTTFSPVDHTIKKNEDGSVSVLCSEVDQMYGTKGEMVFTLYPDKAYLEIKGRLYNRTNLPQTFLWWANPAVAVNEYTQSIFPPDVTAVFDHGKRDVSKFPIATGVYYKYDYGRGVDISRYKNIPVPTSYMAYHSDFNFVGGYDYHLEAGVLHIADHHVSPGKKQWTWGCGDFGKAWDRNLTDHNGPYIELMTGMYTDNQPDFTWLKPFEEKTFTQYFMPYKKASMVKNASIECVMNLEKDHNNAHIVVYTTAVYPNAKVVLHSGEKEIYSYKGTISPTKVLEEDIKTDIPETHLTLDVYDASGRNILSYTPKEKKIEKIPDPMVPAKQPEEIMTVEELYLTGLHIEQYRHATYDPDPYYLEALRRDSGDIRTNTAYGMLLLRRGQFAKSETYFRTALKRMTWKNPNPYDSEAYYCLGLSLWYQGRLSEAYDAFYKATWTAEDQERSYYYLAVIASQNHDFRTALEHVEKSLIKNYHNLKARALRGILLVQLGRKNEAEEWFQKNIELDPFDYVSNLELEKLKQKKNTDRIMKIMQNRSSSFIECAMDYADAGFYEDAVKTLQLCTKEDPMLVYYAAAYAAHYDKKYSEKLLKTAASKDPKYCFPDRLEDIAVLKYAIENNSEDSYAPYYLGCLLYDKKQYEDAVAFWKKSASLNDTYPTVLRNLSLAYFNKKDDKVRARKLMEKAFRLDDSDARIFQELDQLYKKIGIPVKKRFANYNQYSGLWHQRDELYVEYVTMLNDLGYYQKAYDLIMAHKFHPWEGGEGKVTSQYVTSLIQLAVQELKEENPAKAKELLTKALTYPDNLGEGKLIIAKDNNVHYWLGIADQQLKDIKGFQDEMQLATLGNSEPAGMMYYNDQPADLILYKGLAYRALGMEDQAMSCFHKLIDYGEKHYFDNVRIDYFAVSLPDLQLFDEDLNIKNRVHCDYLIALGNYGMGNYEKSVEYYALALKADCSHQGAILYNKLVKLWRPAKKSK
jgi:Flp pilus assembly protein TadD, contains TPR repeats